MRRYFYIYKITNRTNGRFYYGKHCTDNLDDGYMGSGLALKKAIEKYGMENFEKKILKFCESDEELSIVESRLVSQKFIENHPKCYNMKPGGKGGFAKGLWTGRKRSEENKQKLRVSLKGHEVTEAAREKLRLARIGKKLPRE